MCHWQSNVNQQNGRKRSIKQRQIDAADFHSHFIPLSDSWGAKLRFNVITFMRFLDHFDLAILFNFCVISFLSFLYNSRLWHTGKISKPESVKFFPSIKLTVHQPEQGSAIPPVKGVSHISTWRSSSSSEEKAHSSSESAGKNMTLYIVKWHLKKKTLADDQRSEWIEEKLHEVVVLCEEYGKWKSHEEPLEVFAFRGLWLTEVSHCYFTLSYRLRSQKCWNQRKNPLSCWASDQNSHSCCSTLPMKPKLLHCLCRLNNTCSSTSKSHRLIPHMSFV